MESGQAQAPAQPSAYQVKHVAAQDAAALAAQVAVDLNAIPAGSFISVSFVSVTDAFIVFKG